ncbi:MAG: CPBP family intramembrane metalloprotease [Planctomycetes bacterium]|nr:CPBP family intramembrane metalloprotease [Planctomycetota bacterium]
MKKRNRHSTSQLLNFTQNSYLDRTSRPIYAIIFLLPFIIFYEWGTIWINTDLLNQSQVRVVAFVWLQNLLEYLGSSDKLAWVAPPVAVVVILVALQLSSRKPWGFSLGDLWRMGIECILLAVPLIVFSLFLNSPTGPQDDMGRFDENSTRLCRGSGLVVCASRLDSGFGLNDPSVTGNNLSSTAMKIGSGRENPIRNSTMTNAIHYVKSPAVGSSDAERLNSNGVQNGMFSNSITSKSLLASIVTGIGAGIYEELVFRLILICVLMLLFQDVLRLTHKNSIILSVLVSAGLFSAHHHIVLVNGQLALSAAFNWTEFGFRTVAGVYFAVLFAIRGFGITAGTHAFYDIIATIINAAFFSSAI